MVSWEFMNWKLTLCSFLLRKKIIKCPHVISPPKLCFCREKGEKGRESRPVCHWEGWEGRLGALVDTVPFSEWLRYALTHQSSPPRPSISTHYILDFKKCFTPWLVPEMQYRGKPLPRTQAQFGFVLVNHQLPMPPAARPAHWNCQSRRLFPLALVSCLPDCCAPPGINGTSSAIIFIAVSSLTVLSLSLTWLI